MTSQVRINSIKRSIKRAQRISGTPLWIYFLIIFAICTVSIGGLEFALHYKRGTDMSSMSFISGVFLQIFVQTIVWTIILRYFNKRDLKKLQRELEMEEESRGG